ncbi:MAG: DNA repair protein RecO [Planctomycetota bacterium]|jgi:DNA repair protein RecO (recombination protein O)
MLKKDTAIFIRTLDYSDTSQIVTLFGRKTGKMDAIAKGSKRPRSSFGGAIEMFAFGEIIFSDSAKEKLVTLTEFEQQKDFSALSSNLYALNCALFGAELLSEMTDFRDPHTELFESFVQFVENISQSTEKENVLRFLILFQLSLLKEAGLQLVLNGCSNCRSKYDPSRGKSYFSSSANGLICRDCEVSFPDRIRLSKKAANTLNNLKTIAKETEQTLKEIEKVFIHHFSEYLHKKPKMAKHILRQ